MNFKELHYQDGPLLICNAWDARSASTAEQLKFQAIGTSSAAIAATLGYADGEQMAFKTLERVVRSIQSATALPLSVDIEAGYSRKPHKIADHIKCLYDSGVMGVNIEDSLVDGDRYILEPALFAKRLEIVKNELERQHVDIFINVRTDTYVIPHAEPLKETMERMPLYQSSGADGIFVPGLQETSEIQAVVESTSLPINLMCMPELPGFDNLKEIGVKRLSMGNFLFEAMHTKLEKMLMTITTEGSFKSVFKC
ncbi:MAG: isocitrate lyase/phosphoenolpyruvate mutase family protein [Roseivirga sp.]